MTPPLAATTARLIREGLTRQVFWDFPEWLRVSWYVLAVASVFVFVYGVGRPVARYMRGNREGLPPARELPGRLRRAVALLLEHRTIARRARGAGLAHAAIFYGFCTLFLGTVILGIDTDITQPIFGVSYFQGAFYEWYSLALDVLGVVLLAGLLAMMYRRAVLQPAKLNYTRPDRPADDPAQLERRSYRWGDWAFLGGLLYLLVTGYVLEGLRIAMDHPARAGYNPVGWLVAQPFNGLGHGLLGVLRMGIWWAHGLVAITLVAAIPWTKAAHMLTSFTSLVLRDPLAGRRLRVIPPERAQEPAGYGTLADLSALHLLQLDACTKCGRCHEVCPANATGRPLSPRDVVLELREDAKRAFDAEVGIGGVLGTLLHRSVPERGADADDAWAVSPLVSDERIRAETVWSCLQCNACVAACPVGIEQAPIINGLRRRLVEEGEMPSELQGVLRTLRKSGNSFGENRRKRGRWTDDLEFEVRDARTVPVDVLWFVGDYASFDPRSQRISQSLARLLETAGISFGILYDGERNAGNDVRRVGEEGLWELFAEENIEVLREAEFTRIITTDPHSLNTLRHEYPSLGGDWPTDHHTTFLLELIEAGLLTPQRQLSHRVTYHDPCYLGRHVGEYDAPRRLLELIGCELIEMPRNRENSFCCGAGGGRIWMKDPPGAERPSENRIREAAALPGVELFVVACPKDLTMFEDAAKTAAVADRLEVRELTELLEQALVGTPAAAATG